jgi:serine/threonine protein phosphatase PrpC
MELNGDAFMVEQGDGFTLTALIDGLGHGQFANRAALTARQYIVNHFDQPLEAIFRGVGRACRATRGVVLALARFDWATETIKLTFASVGNIEARVFGNPAPTNFIVRRGVIGLNAPNPVVTEHCWGPDWVLVLFTDGLQSRWHWNDFPELAEAPAPHAAQRLLQALARDNDDATVIVVRKRRMRESDSL